MYAIIKTGGKQYCVEEGKIITVEKLDVAAGDEVTFEEVLLISGDAVKIGQPTVAGLKLLLRFLHRAKKRKSVFLSTKQNPIIVVARDIASHLRKYRLKKLKADDYRYYVSECRRIL